MNLEINTPSSLDEPREAWTSIKRGLFGKCPHCGEGHIFRAYLKVRDRCEVCGENLSHQRSDDAAPYMTIFVVGHIIVGAILFGEEHFDPVPMWFNITVWPFLTLILCLAILPMMKGALVGLQWAMKMHGFGLHDANAPTPEPSA
jgi:uncharacterized protein (DUF983 family)